MMEVVVTTGAIRRAKLSQIVTTSKPTPNFLQAGCPSSRPTNIDVRALKGKTSIFSKAKKKHPNYESVRSYLCCVICFV